MNDEQGPPITRRLFCGLGGIVFGAVKPIARFASELGQTNPLSIFSDLRDMKTAEQVASTFARMKTPSLMAFYSCFSRKFLEEAGQDPVRSLSVAAQKEKEKYPLSNHRLDALPAVCAAHLLPTTNSPMRREYYCSILATALGDPRRELLQIVTHNLVSAVTPNIDSMRFFSADQSVLIALKRVIRSAEDNIKLLTPAVIALQFVLNARALLQSNGDVEAIRPYDTLISFVLDSKASNSWYLRRLIELHAATYKNVKATDMYSLPPPHEEALMGWRNFPHGWDYFAHLGLIKCRQLYTNLSTISGKLAADEAMTTEQATHVLPKSATLIHSFNLDRLLHHHPDFDRLPSSLGSEFVAFLRRELPVIASDPGSYGIATLQPSAEELALADCVPFARFSRYGVLNAMTIGADKQDRSVVFGALETAEDSVVRFNSYFQWTDAFVRLLQRYGWVKGNTTIPPEVIKQARQEADMAAHDAESKESLVIDSEQQELGNVPLPVVDDDADREKH